MLNICGVHECAQDRKFMVTLKYVEYLVVYIKGLGDGEFIVILKYVVSLFEMKVPTKVPLH